MIHTPPRLSAAELEKLLAEFDRLFAEVCSAVPQPNSFDLIGTEKSPWKPLVNEKGVITLESQYVTPGSEPDPLRDVRRTLLTLFDPETADLGKFVRPLSHDCLDGWLPVSRVRFTTSRFPEAELLALVDDEDALQVRAVCGSETFFYRIPLPSSQNPAELLRMEPPVPARLPDGSWFDRALKALKTHWQSKFAAVLDWDFPHPHLKNGILAALVKTFITQYDGALRYGATRYYCDEGRCAESFPPTVLTAFEGAFFYGLEADAFHFLGRFIGDFVSADGTILHRGNGASLSEHGMLLALFAQAKRQTADETFFREYGPPIRQVALRLCRLTEEAAPELVRGCPEDDLRNAPPRQWFSSNLWIARGLLEYARTFPGVIPEEKAAAFADRAVRRCCGSAVPCPDGEVFLPPCAEYRIPFSDMNDFIAVAPGDDIHSLASYTNYRIYPEMLSSGLLPPETARQIIAFRRARGGDFHGATAFRIFRDFPPYARCLDDWPLYNMLSGLRIYGDHAEFIRLLAGHLALHQSRGTFFAPEMSFRDRLDSTACIPSQMTLPLAVRYLFSHINSITQTGRNT